VDLDATAADAAELADRALGWLVREEIVSAERTDCVLGASAGHPPGEQWTRAAADPDIDWHWPWADGLDIQTSRTVFCGGQGGAQYATCPQCASRTWLLTEENWGPIEGRWELFADAIAEWTENGTGNVTCSSCARPSDLTRWRWSDDYFAFGYLGFEFWNWPAFAPRFIADLRRILGDHQVVVVEGKL
jgi:hypothetical protein